MAMRRAKQWKLIETRASPNWPDLRRDGYQRSRRTTSYGLSRGIGTYRIAFDPSLVSELPFEIEIAAVAATRLISGPNSPTALFCANDIQAIGALFACQRQNVRVPDDISIIGFDDLPSTRVVNPPLSSVHVPAKQMGEEAAKAIIAAAREEIPVRSRTLATKLVMRKKYEAKFERFSSAVPYVDRILKGSKAC